MVDYQQLRQRFLTALDAAARSQESGDFAAIETGYEELDALLPRNVDPAFDKLHSALEFWDGWIDAQSQLAVLRRESEGGLAAPGSRDRG